MFTLAQQTLMLGADLCGWLWVRKSTEIAPVPETTSKPRCSFADVLGCHSFLIAPHTFEKAARCKCTMQFLSDCILKKTQGPFSCLKHGHNSPNKQMGCRACTNAALRAA